MTIPYKTCPICGQRCVMHFKTCQRCSYLYPAPNGLHPVFRPVQRLKVALIAVSFLVWLSVTAWHFTAPPIEGTWAYNDEWSSQSVTFNRNGTGIARARKFNQPPEEHPFHWFTSGDFLTIDTEKTKYTLSDDKAVLSIVPINGGRPLDYRRQ